MGVERYIFLGDYVGYGADPRWVVDEVRFMVSQGAVAIRGNHDEAVFNPAVKMNDIATTAMEWTRTQLSDQQREFLRALPMTAEQDDRLYVHASANEPAAWHYVVGPFRRYLGSVSAQVVAEAPCTVTVVRQRQGTSSAEAAMAK